MVKQTALLATLLSQVAYAGSCPFPREGQSHSVLHRASHSLSDFQSACAAKKGSAMESGFTDAQEGVASLATQIHSTPTLAGFASWQGLPITCDNYAGFVSEQRDAALNRFSMQVNAADSEAYATCFDGLPEDRSAAAENMFTLCIDSIRDERLRTANKLCAKYDDKRSAASNTNISAIHAKLAQNFVSLLSEIQNGCTGDANQVRETGLRAASALSSLFAAVEPDASFSGLGIALSGSVLNASVEHLFEKTTNGALLKPEPSTRDFSCLLVDAIERDLACKTTASGDKKSGASRYEALLETGATTTKSGSVDAVLKAMERVEKRAHADAGLPGSVSKPMGFSDNASVNDLVAAMGMRVRDIARVTSDRMPASAPVTGMPTYLKQVAQDLIFVSKNWSKKGPDQTVVLAYLGDERGYLTASFSEAMRNMGIENSRNAGFLGETLANLIAHYEAYDNALESGEAGTIEAKRSALVATVDKIAPNSVAKLVGQAMDRHWTLMQKPDSGLRKIRNYELSRNLDNSLEESVARKPDALMSETFPLLRSAYAEPVKTTTFQYGRKMLDALRSIERNPSAFSTPQLTEVFESSVEPLLNRCMLLANVFAVEEYERVCGAFLCDGILGAFNGGDGATALREKQCAWMSDRKTITEKVAERFLAQETRGKLCGVKTEPSTFQKVQNFLRPTSSTRDSKGKRR
jgi:hypothetical protein